MWFPIFHSCVNICLAELLHLSPVSPDTTTNIDVGGLWGSWNCKVNKEKTILINKQQSVEDVRTCRKVGGYFIPIVVSNLFFSLQRRQWDNILPLPEIGKMGEYVKNQLLPILVF